MDDEAPAPSVQRKIELQSDQDLRFLVRNVHRAAAARVDEAFPPVAPRDDTLRQQIETLVQDYITRTFALAAPNLTINSLPAQLSPSAEASPPPAYEPFDARKHRRLADLVATEERLLEEVAALKRSVPAAAAAAQATRLREALRRDEQRLARKVAAVRGAEKAGLEVRPLERQEGVEGAWEGAVRALGRVKREVPAVVAKMERARVAGEYVVGER